MTRYFILVAAIAGCTGKSDRADSVDAAIPAIDTLKPVAATATDTIATGDSAVNNGANPAAKTSPPSTRLGRDIAFPPPRNLPRLDSAKKKRPI